ncbi:hypothetical protein TCON_0159 [Astathelohania contejeani]|uniref:Uncharacterized protein n=1 Tax=Astathelohania contejeani TaxID=164912 RepID=A0ABQ7I2L9_9MICR|nr:hypothetical protein TCON_0159 [Thelohania contejeani]
MQRLKEEKQLIETQIKEKEEELRRLIKKNIKVIYLLYNEYIDHINTFNFNSSDLYKIVLSRCDQLCEINRNKVYEELKCIFNGDIIKFSKEKLNSSFYLLYTFDTLRKRIEAKYKKEKEDDDKNKEENDIKIVVNIIDGRVELYQYNSKVLSFESVVPSTPNLCEIFYKKDFCFQSNITEILFFIFKFKLEFIIAECIILLESPVYQLQRLVSFSFDLMPSIINEEDVVNSFFIEFSIHKLKEYQDWLFIQNTSDIKKTLIYVYFFILAPGLSEYANLQWFYNKKEYYYVKWLEK